MALESTIYEKVLVVNFEILLKNLPRSWWGGGGAVRGIQVAFQDLGLENEEQLFFLWSEELWKGYWL